MFYRGSRYEKVAEAKIKDARGREVAYKRIRFIPKTEGLTQHMVKLGERLDLIAQQHYQNPELFWRICDANRAMLPDELGTEPGQKILIPPAMR